MSETLTKLVQELQGRNTEDALAILQALDNKKREENYVAYWTPYPAQAECIRKFTSEVKTFGILGGNRSGKTELGAFISVAWALGRDYFLNYPAYDFIRDLPIPNRPCNIWVVGLDFPTLRDVIWREKLRFGRVHPAMVPKSDAIVKKVNEADWQIFFQNGSVITGKSADSGREKFQGASVDLVWIDEEPDSEIYDECYQRTLDCGGKLLLTLTPLTDTHSGVKTPWVYDLYQEAQKGKRDTRFVQLSFLDNPFVPQEEKDKAVEKWAGHYEERARLYGDFIRKSGIVYTDWDPKFHMIKPIQIPKDWRRIVSIDPAATGTTAAVWAAISPKDNMYLYREYYERDFIVSEHAKNLIVRNAGEPVDIWLIDPKWGSQRNAETHKTGAQLYRDNRVPVRLASVAEDYGLNESREYLKATITEGTRHPQLFVFNDLLNFRHEIENYVWDQFQAGEQKGMSKDKPRKRHDHLMNAWQYLCAMRPKGFKGSPDLSLEARRKQADLNSYT